MTANQTINVLQGGK